MKKILLIIFILIFFQNCGYTPLYGGKQKVDFYIAEISFNDENYDLSNFVKTNLNNYLKENEGKKFDITGDISYAKNSVSKDSEGNTVEYELSCSIKFIIVYDKLEKVIIINEKFKMKNFNDEFEERRYERSIKQNIARSVTSKLLFQLSKFDAI